MLLLFLTLIKHNDYEKHSYADRENGAVNCVAQRRKCRVGCIIRQSVYESLRPLFHAGLRDNLELLTKSYSEKSLPIFREHLSLI